MKPKEGRVLDIALNIEVNTADSCSRMLQTAIEVLIFQRNQIPFTYDLFRTIVGKISKAVAATTQREPKWNNYQLVKQRQTAIDTLATIQRLFKELPNVVCHGQEHITAMLLFGSTIYTAKEAFIINLPKVNPKHNPLHHQKSLEPALKQLAMKLTLSDELQPTGKIPGQTNMFLLLQSHNPANKVESDLEWHSMDDYQLPGSCQQYIVNLKHCPPIGTALQCCKDISVFSDFFPFASKRTSSSYSQTDFIDLEDDDELMEKKWYLIGKGIKGYKDVLVKGSSIWEC